MKHLPNAEQELLHRKILLGLTGGIACYKSAALVRLMTAAGAQVQTVMTHAATQFITPLTLQVLSGHHVLTNLWQEEAGDILHITATRKVDAVLIAPCSANVIAKLAQGVSDDLLTTLCLARKTCTPLLIAPAMNVEMWHHPATQRNVGQLISDGIHLLDPAVGEQACGEVGEGRMQEPEILLDSLIALFQTKCLAGKQVLITAGPTYEAIDPIRGIINRSSGKMGYCLARAAHQAGAQVRLISGPTALASPDGVTRIDVTSAAQMHEAVMSSLNVDIVIAVAAVADWRVTHPYPQKLKKSSKAPMLSLSCNPDILAHVVAHTDHQPQRPYCVGFTAESEDLLQKGPAKRLQKGVPLLVGNIGPETFGADDNTLVLFDAMGYKIWPRASKMSLARALIAEISRRITRDA